jgi:thiol-disulfide isomerase/thioredoxin
MKTKLLTTIYLLLILTSLHGQTKKSKLLSVGDPAPPFKAFKWMTGPPVDELSRNKVYVVEFGATWCAPCAAAIPKLTALANKYRDNLTVISFFVMERSTGPNKDKLDYISTVEKYVSKRADKISYSVAVDGPEKEMELMWLRASGTIGVPQAFVIGRDGRIAYLGTNFTDLEAVVANLLSPEFNVEQLPKKVVPAPQAQTFDNEKLLLIDGNGGGEDDFAFRSIIQKYNGKIAAGNPEYINSNRKFEYTDSYLFDRVQLIGVSLSGLYYLAYSDTLSNQVYSRNYLWEYPDTIKYPDTKRSYGKYWHVPLIEVADIFPFKASHAFPDNRYNYSLKVPSGLGTAKFLQETMRRDLMTYFGYDVTVETRNMPYWRLIRSGNKTALEKLRSKNPNLPFELRATDDPFYFNQAHMSDLIWTLGSWFGYGRYDYGKMPLAEQAAFVDETGIDFSIDFTYDRRWTFQEWRKYLNTVGLDVVKGYRPIKVVVIRDSNL